jgi:hypothetical protein
MKNLTRRLSVRAAAAALYALASLTAPATLLVLGGAKLSFAKDGGDDGGNSGSGGGDDGGNSGSSGGDDGGNSGHGSDDGGNSGHGSDDNGGDDNGGDDSSNSGRGSDDDGSDDDSDDSGRSGSGRGSDDRPEVAVSLTQDQLAGVQAGRLKLVDNLGRVLELEVETEHGVTTVSAKPHGGASRRNPGPITGIAIVPTGN